MKYLRTTDGIYRVNLIPEKNDIYAYIITYVKDSNNHLTGAKRPITQESKFEDLGEIINEADTIEELCDYLMFVDNDEKEDILITDVDEINITYSKKETCYACLKIKLSNGAIRIEPVAKFNEKWSFKLI